VLRKLSGSRVLTLCAGMPISTDSVYNNDSSTKASDHTLVFNRGALGVDNNDLCYICLHI
jgi:hypothetical protein